MSAKKKSPRLSTEFKVNTIGKLVHKHAYAEGFKAGVERAAKQAETYTRVGALPDEIRALRPEGE